MRAYPVMVVASCIVAIGAAYGGACLAWRAYRAVLPDVRILRSAYPVAVGKTDRGVVYRFQKARPPHWLPLRQIPRKAVAAVLLAEDASFFQHKGYSVDAMRAAWEHNRQPGVKTIRGGSTITQQVAKNLFLSKEKSLTRKARELLLAIDLERSFPKTKILETYLNIAEWGPGVYGIGNASLRYFSKPASELSPREAATLAFLLPNPNRYQHSLRDDGMTDFAETRVNTILERMWKTGHLSDEEYTSAGQADGLGLELARPGSRPEPQTGDRRSKTQ